MTYREGIANFSQQCLYEPVVVNKEKLKPYKRVIIAGMGGSRLAADILNMLHPEMELHIHSDFGLPALSEEVLSNALIIANSYSGDTAETIDVAQTALSRGYQVAVITTGGALKQFAEKNTVPSVIFPDEGLPHRLALGYDLAAIMALLGMDLGSLKACAQLPSTEEQAKAIADKLANFVPLVYAPDQLMELAYIWKVVLNETAKVPAFCNRFPEFDHNELASFDDSSRQLYGAFRPIFIRDFSNMRIQQRMDAAQKILLGKGIESLDAVLSGETLLQQIVSSALLAHWTGVLLAEQKGIDPLATPVIEEFKKN